MTDKHEKKLQFKMSLLGQLKELNKSVFVDLSKEYSENFHLYTERLKELSLDSISLDEEEKEQASILHYNLSKGTGKHKLLVKAIKFCGNCLKKILWNLQLAVQLSSRGNHVDAHKEAIAIIEAILFYIRSLSLKEKEQLLFQQIEDIMKKQQQKSHESELQTIKRMKIVERYSTECELVNKKFHIADIMAMEPINPMKSQQKFEGEQFIFSLVFLSISCFTRATERFYSHEHDDKHYHMKAIKIASYIYSQKSTYLRFLRRTYINHYNLFLIEEEEQLGQTRRKVEPDPPEISLLLMPWQAEEQRMEEKVESSVLNAEISYK